MEAAAELGELAQGTLNFSSVLQNVTDELVKTIDFDTCSAVLVDNAAGYNSVRHLMVRHGAPVLARTMGSTYPLAGTIAEDVVNSESAMLVTASSGESIRKRYPGSVPRNARIGYLSNIAVPVSTSDQIPCVILIKSSQPDAYTAPDVEFVSRVVAAH